MEDTVLYFSGCSFHFKLHQFNMSFNSKDKRSHRYKQNNNWTEKDKYKRIIYFKLLKKRKKKVCFSLSSQCDSIHESMACTLQVIFKTIHCMNQEFRVLLHILYRSLA